MTIYAEFIIKYRESGRASSLPVSVGVICACGERKVRATQSAALPNGKMSDEGIVQGNRK